MRFILASALAVPCFASLFSGAVGLNNFAQRSDITSDSCANVDAVLKVPDLFLPGQFTTIGQIDACICVSTLPLFVATNPIAITAAALVGRPAAIAALTDMINQSAGNQQCQYPPHSVPVCAQGNACSFTCKDGYSTYPAGAYPTQCVCSPPLTECNGKCGVFQGCSSGLARRETYSGGGRQCPHGQTACGILGRSARSWECVDTQTDLESCGGCIIPLQSSLTSPEGEDCTALAGISDVSCIKGSCAVHRCMPGYDISSSGSSCIYSEDKDPVILAAQYGLEYVPL